MSTERPPRSLFDFAVVSTMRRAGAMGVSANRITLLRDADGNGVAEIREVFLDGLNQPFGMSLAGRHVLRRQHRWLGCLSLHGWRDLHLRAGTEARPRSSRLAIGHESICCPALMDGSSMLASARSPTSPSNGMEVEEGRAAIYELDLASGSSRIFASGLRNAVGLAWEPQTGALVDRGQRARRAGRRDAARLSDLGARRRLLRLALLLLGADGRRPRAAGSGRGRQGHHAGLRAGRTHRVARPVLGAGGHASRAFPTAWRSASTARGTAAR